MSSPRSTPPLGHATSGLARVPAPRRHAGVRRAAPNSACARRQCQIKMARQVAAGLATNGEVVTGRRSQARHGARGALGGVGGMSAAGTEAGKTGTRTEVRPRMGCEKSRATRRAPAPKTVPNQDGTPRAKTTAAGLASDLGRPSAGAGRKPAVGRRQVSHVARPSHDPRNPVHVTLRAQPGVRSLRSSSAFSALCTAIASAHRRSFRIIHFSAQTDHLHLMVEASSRASLSRGIQGLAGRTARALNRANHRRGAVWSGRYHARPLATPREVRNALVYVLLNFRKHLRAPPAVDPRSSGPWFRGWSRPHPTSVGSCPVAQPRTWLAAVGWRRAGGPLDATVAPA